jgi:uncharacterized membrane protein YfcA
MALSLIFGTLIGFALGLTGGGGSIFAVPMLVYGLAVPPREAIGISLAAVGLTALIGGLGRLWAGEVNLAVGLLFALAGMLGAPVGTAVNGYLPEWLLLGLFAGLMVVVAGRMWRKAGQAARSLTPDAGTSDMNVRHLAALGVVGFVTGVLSGLFGVGGGFLIVPGLVLAGKLPVHRAVATSLLVIALISASGLASYLLAGRHLGFELTILFVAGGAVGMLLGTRLSRRLSGPRLQRLFAVVMVAVAVFVIGKTVV